MERTDESNSIKRDSTIALRVRGKVRFDPKRADLGGITASLLDDLSERSHEYVVDLLLAEDRQRVTYGASKDKAFTVVYLQEGMTIWDNATRSFATITADAIPRRIIAPARAFAIETQENNDETVFILTSDDTSVGGVRHELTVSRREDWARFGPALMRILHCGPACHAASGMPWETIAGAGLIIREQTLAENSKELISDLEFESLELVEASDRDFTSPEGYQPLAELLKKGGDPRPSAPAEGILTPDEIQAAVVKQALEDTSGSLRQALRINEELTPDCLGSTRFGSLTASLHQDFLTVASNAINTLAPLLGPTTIAGGTWAVPWLANLAAVNAANPAAPGTGLFCFFRQPRVPTLPPAPAGGGGGGLLDRLAFRSIYERDAAGLLRTQREFTAGTLATTLVTWGVGAPTDANLIAASGDLTMVSPFDQRVITEAYETTELGVFTVGGLPGSMPPFSFGSMRIGAITTPPLFTIGIAGLTGTVNFASLGGGPLVTTATIGNVGNIVVGLRLPTTTFTATVTRSTTGFGGAVVILGTIGSCLAFPFLCPLAVTLAVLAAYVMNNVTVVTATATGVTWTLDVRFDFDPATERVEPSVSLLARTGAVTVGTFGPTPNIIANAVDSLVAAFGNLFDAWGALLADQGTKAIQQALRNQGIQLPVAGRQNQLRAIDGGAESLPGLLLLLRASIRPFDDVASQPYSTQVVRTGNAISEGMVRQLSFAHQDMRNGLNPIPAPPPPGPGPALTVGSFAGLGLSQNALNCYIFQQWVQKRFEVTITDPAIINSFLSVAPPPLVAPLPRPTMIHIWAATPPRIEIAPHEIALGTRPLVVFFDDVRTCFEIPNVEGMDGSTNFVGIRELSCNFKTSATIELAWPWVFSLRVDPIRSSSVYEPRTWEIVHPNDRLIMSTVAPQDLAKLVDLIADMLIAPMSAIGVRAPAAVRSWARPLPAMQQEVFTTGTPPGGLRVQQIYLEMLGRHKALYVLPAVDTALLELFDGSGQPTLNFILGSAVPTTPLGMTCAQGAILRNRILPLIGLPTGP